MKKLIKKWWFWSIIGTILIIGVIVLTVNANKGVGTAGISLEEYEQIQLGMTQFEVNSIIDAKDEWEDDNIYDKCSKKISENKKNGVYTYVYKYFGENEGYAIITYEVDYSEGFYGMKYPEVIKKEEYNLK